MYLLAFIHRFMQNSSSCVVKIPLKRSVPTGRNTVLFWLGQIHQLLMKRHSPLRHWRLWIKNYDLQAQGQNSQLSSLSMRYILLLFADVRALKLVCLKRKSACTHREYTPGIMLHAQSLMLWQWSIWACVRACMHMHIVCACVCVHLHLVCVCVHTYMCLCLCERGWP